MCFVFWQFDVAIWMAVRDAEYSEPNPKITVDPSLVVVADVRFSSEQ